MDKGKVDARRLKNGQVRLRFRLSRSALHTVNEAIHLAYIEVGYCSWGALLDLIATSFQAGPPPRERWPHAAGRERFRVKLYDDQYENVRCGLDYARSSAGSDTEALVLMAEQFLQEYRHQP